MLSACTLDCPDACSLDIQPGPQGLRVRGNPEHPFTQGFTCAKIRRYLQRLHSPERILSPWIKENTGWKRISWEQALDICAMRLQDYRSDPARVLHISGHGARGISKMLVDSFFAALGSSRLQGSLCDGTGIQAFIRDFGALEQNPLQDLQNARWIVNWGRDVRRSSVHTFRILQLARQQNAHVTSIWPGGKGYERFSDKLIRIAPGRDRFLALAVIKVLYEQGCLSSQAVRRTRNWQQVENLLRSSRLQDLTRACEVQEEDIFFLARVYSQHPVSSLIGWGLQRHSFGGEGVRMINALAWLSGNVGLSGAGVYYNISSGRNFDLSWLPERSSRFLSLPCLGRDLETAADPSLNMAWINGTNPANQTMESRRVVRALSALDFVVVADAFWTDTALGADLVLPCALMGEEEDVLGSCMHDYVQMARQVQDPPAQARSDLWMIQELNQRLGLGLDIMNRRACFEKSLVCSDPEAAMQELLQKGYFLAREQRPAFEQGTHHPQGLFQALDTISSGSRESEDYPFRLLSLIRRDAIHSQMLASEQQMPPTVWVHPEAPGLQGVDLQKEVYLVSELGRLKVQVAFDSSLHPGALIYRRGDWMRLGGGVNQLIKPSLSDMQTGAAQYSQRVGLQN